MFTSEVDSNRPSPIYTFLFIIRFGLSGRPQNKTHHFIRYNTRMQHRPTTSTHNSPPNIILSVCIYDRNYSILYVKIYIAHTPPENKISAVKLCILCLFITSKCVIFGKRRKARSLGLNADYLKISKDNACNLTLVWLNLGNKDNWLSQEINLKKL